MKSKKTLSSNTQLLIIALPSIVMIFLVKYLAYPGMLLAFKNYRNIPGEGFFHSLMQADWVGFKNFEFLFLSPDITTILRNTLVYNLIFIFGGLVIAVAAAIALNEIVFKKFRNTVQTLMFFPYFMSWVSISYMMKAFLDADNGLLNQWITAAGGTAINWYQDPTWWPVIIIFMGLWKMVGYNSVIYLSSIMSIDQSLYEAATIDGASKWEQIRYITLPALRPMMIILTILSVGSIMYTDFGLFYQLPMNSGALYSVTQTLDVFVYNALQLPSSLGLSAAAALFQSVIGCILVIIANASVRKIDPENSLY